MKKTISMAAKEAHVGIETIRYYQKIGLIEKPVKPAQGYREYSAQTISNIRFIKRAQELGFTLSEIEILIGLGEQQCAETLELANAKLTQVQQKIGDLQSIADTLKDLIQHCKTRKDDETCPIIYSISQ